MTWACVIGDPIAHSWSPILHNSAYRYLGKDIVYRKERVEKDQLADFMKRLDDTCAGVSVTMPHKQQVMDYLDKVDSLASMVGSVNTVVPSGGLLTGFNTDVAGIVEAIRQVKGRDYHPRRAVIFGARATASSALIALYGELKCRQVTICARSVAGPGSVMETAARASLIPQVVRLSDVEGVRAAVEGADLIISTMPKHVMDGWDFHPRADQTLLDVVYDPMVSVLAGHFIDVGAQVVPGWLMLVHQAIRQIQLFTSATVPPSLLIDALVEAGCVPPNQGRLPWS